VGELFGEIDVDTNGVVTLSDRPTTRKTRVVAHNQQVVRADWESTAPLAEADRAAAVACVVDAIRDADAVVLSDYAKGFLSREIVEAAFLFQQQVEEKEKIIVGINKYVDSETGEKIPVLAIDPDVERNQIARIDETRAKRDAGRWREAMDRLSAQATAHGELMPAFVECARAMATVGEQVQVLKETYGEYHDPGYF